MKTKIQIYAEGIPFSEKELLKGLIKHSIETAHSVYFNEVNKFENNKNITFKPLSINLKVTMKSESELISWTMSIDN
ncbi:MAG: hypothetical protein ABRQ25_14365 [Clostridiaceae bacterium]